MKSLNRPPFMAAHSKIQNHHLVIRYTLFLFLTILFGLNDIACSSSSDEVQGPPFVIHEGLENWSTCQAQSNEYIALVSTRWLQTSTFNTDKLTKGAVITKIEFPFRMWNKDEGDVDYSWDGSPGTFELNIIEGPPNQSKDLWTGSISFTHALDTTTIKAIVPTKKYSLQPKKTYTLVMRSTYGVGTWTTTCNSDHSSVSYQYDQKYEHWYGADEGFPFRITVAE
jgi:hypothetical protein